MTDLTYGVARPNWTSTYGVASMSSAFEFITIQTTVDIRTYATNVLAGSSLTVSTASQNNLNKLLEIISLRGQPVVMGNVTVASGIYTILVATEHFGGWGSIQANSSNNLLARLAADGINFGFGQNLSSVTPTNSAAVANSTVIPLSSAVGVLAGSTFTGTGVVGGVVSEVVVPGATGAVIYATLPQTISNGTTLTFTPPAGVAFNDTPGGSGLAVTFSTVLT